ncbi:MULTISPECIES: sensor histidine kinase [Paenibacillus]|uniref:histidine kinase n=3 Tax=Paenibacillus naphthalenovorans TaxID=162209 RepID=A0A0U2VU27_9BACL|nr:MULTISPECIES: sensor histidine kinase [Paenibacillus]ALS23031.1 histidine kinase [Paenibacillus naphthalenovorans]NTZ17370.1 sensor histidine kinase [Paenibacillus sp. JMULE4]GCL71908.1 sensor histidine kinase [Paenibacillus naphthalenovorans]SDI42234.1 Histidine kinase-, DNA gyrase B-, and HSP90-like ATPase [Paenibacillus naphthalenovorans]
MIIFSAFFNGLMFIIYYNFTQHLDNYEMILRSFVRMNDIANTVEATQSSLNQYLSRGYEKDRDDLTAGLRLLNDYAATMEQETFLHNSQFQLLQLTHLLDRFQQEVEVSVTYYDRQEIDAYTAHYDESFKLAGFIMDNTRNITSSELTSYREQFVKITESKHLFQIMGRTMFFVSIVISILYSLFIFHGVSLPLRKLAARSRKISSGDFNVSDISLERKDEIGELMAAYVVMGHNIERLLREVKSQEEYKRLLQEMELKALQSQMNPHFLFNTLNIISRLAFMEKAYKTEDLMMNLSKLLRYHLKKVESRVTLREELDIIHKYLYIQKVRFQDQIDIQFEVDEACLDIEMPSLTLQPIVENIFVHGIQSAETITRIRIHIYRDEGCEKIEIHDNGAGMSRETIERLLNVNSESYGLGLGIQNVIRRLRIFYQTSDVISIHSEMGSGTCIRLNLPRHRHYQIV